jgi:hypothetical protein
MQRPHLSYISRRRHREDGPLHACGQLASQHAKKAMDGSIPSASYYKWVAAYVPTEIVPRSMPIGTYDDAPSSIDRSIDLIGLDRQRNVRGDHFVAARGPGRRTANPC